MNIFLTILLFYTGTAVGSFLSVLIHRYKTKKKGIIAGRSMCPHCKTKLEALDLVPMASYLLLKGRCRYCEKEISPHYFYIEFLTGLMFALMYLKFPFLQFQNAAPYMDFDARDFLLFLNHIIIGSFLVIIFFYDLLYKQIPDIFSLTPIPFALMNSLFFGMPEIKEMIIGGGAAAVFFEGQILISKGRWLGSGDVRLGILMGLLLGWKLLIVALLCAYILGALMSLYLLATKKVSIKSSIAFGPYLVTGTFVALLAGNFLMNWYLNLFSL